MYKFFINSVDVINSEIFIRDEKDLKHLSKVLRLKKGDQVEISDGEKWEYTGQIVEITKEYCKLKIIDKQTASGEPTVKVTLFQGIPKAKKMETIIQKGVEIGVTEFVPVFMTRTVVQDKGNFNKKEERWQKIADEAVKQCKRSIIPKVKKAVSFEEVLENMKGFDILLMAYENEEKLSIKDVIRGQKGRYKNIGIVIGPEGGFAASEAAQLTAAGAKSVALGKRILRTETAGIVALAMIMYELEL